MDRQMELSSPLSCINRALDRELIFVLLGRDPVAPVIIRAWAEYRVGRGYNKRDDTQIVEALMLADHMEQDRAAVRAEIAERRSTPLLSSSSPGEPPVK